MNKFRIIHVLSFIALFGLSAISYGQVQKGDNNIGFSSSVTTNSALPRNINITVLLSYERFMTDNISAGLAPSMTILTSEGGLAGIYSLNIFGNYYFLVGSGKLLPYAGLLASLNYSISSFDTESSEIEGVSSSGNNTSQFYGGGAKVGLKYFATERINLDANFNYSTNLSARANGQEVSIGEGAILQVFVGVGFIIGKKGS